MGTMISYQSGIHPHRAGTLTKIMSGFPTMPSGYTGDGEVRGYPGDLSRLTCLYAG
jgi:hypothetical protein